MSVCAKLWKTRHQFWKKNTESTSLNTLPGTKNYMKYLKIAAEQEANIHAGEIWICWCVKKGDHSHAWLHSSAQISKEGLSPSNCLL